MSGGRLSEGPIEEIRSLIYAPAIAGADDADFVDMCALNQAHLVMLSDTGILPPDMARELAISLRRVASEGRTALPNDPDLEDQAAMQRRTGQMRDRGLKRVEAIIQRQQGMSSKGDDDRLFLG